MMMLKKNTFLMFVTILVSTGFSCFAQNTLQDLFADMQYYITTSPHRGDLVQHTIWTAQMLGQWARGCEQPMKSCLPVKELFATLSERDIFLLEVAGIVHDIGKAGDLALEKYPGTVRIGDIIQYCFRNGHERIGFEYILHDMPWIQGPYRPYQMVDGTYFNFYDFFHSLGINDEEQKMIAILVGGHAFLRDHVFNVPLDTIAQRIPALIGGVNALAQEVGYSKGVTPALLRMWLLLQFADTYTAFFPVKEHCATALFRQDFIVASPHLHPEDDARGQSLLRGLFPKLESTVRILLNEQYI